MDNNPDEDWYVWVWSDVPFASTMIVRGEKEIRNEFDASQFWRLFEVGMQDVLIAIKPQI